MLKLREQIIRSFLFAHITSVVIFADKSASETLPLGSCKSPFLREEIPGVMPADISADGQGGVKVSIALDVPRGSGGREPGLLLKYSSSARNGRFGYGWTLAYLPTISRCPRKRIKNGFSDKVTFTANDVFCVGGKQLVPVPGTEINSDVYNGSKYYSEEFDKTVYQPFGYRFGQALSDGPLYWISSRSDGVRTVYGKTTDSRVLVKSSYGDVIQGWKPNQEIDPYGNEVNITYVGNGKDNSEIYMSHITYAEGQAAVIFDYEPRPDEIVTYFSGSRQVISRRLCTVTTYSAMPKKSNLSEATELIPVRRYDVTYINSTLNGVSLVETITVCSGCYEKCQRPFKFQYEMVQSGTTPIAFPFRLNSTKDDHSMFTLFSPKIQNSASLGAFKPAAFCNENRHEPVIYPSAVVATESNVQLSVDVNDDGLTDLMFVQYDSEVGVHVNIYLSNGKSFAPSNIESKFQPTEPFLCETTEAYCSCWQNLLDYEYAIYEATNEFHATSFTVFEDDSRGEGLIDLTAVVLTKGPLSSQKNSCTSYMPQVFILQVSGKQNTNEAPTGKLTAYSTASSIDFKYTQNCSVMYGDVTEDFSKDVIISCIETEGWKVWTIDVSSGSATESEPYSSLHESGNITRNVLLRDLDGDGSPDLTMVSLYPSTIEILVSKSLRNGKFGSVIISQEPYGMHNVFVSKSIKTFFAQIPGGATNLVISSTNESAWYLHCFESKGTVKFTSNIEEQKKGDFAHGTDVFSSDINGDGISEILAVTPGKSSSTGLWLRVLYLRPGRIFYEYNYPPIPATDLIGKHYDESNSLYYSDFTGDGKADIGIVRVRYLDKRPYCSEVATNFYLLPSSLLREAPFNKLSEMKDGHGLATSIAYARMTDNGVYIQEGSAPKESCSFWPNTGTTATRQPHVNYQPFSEFLLQEISHSNAASNEPNDVLTTKYVYRGYGSHTQGYGSLGFEFIFAYHSTTGHHSQLTTYSTDFSKHMNGHPVFTAMYKCEKNMITPMTLSTEKKQWQLMTRIPSSQTTGFLFGSYFVVLIDKEHIVYSENGLPQPTQITTKAVQFNSYSLPIASHSLSIDDSIHSKPYPHLLSNFHNNSLEIEYVEPFYYGYSWFVGLASAAVETSLSHYGPINSKIDYATASTIKRADRKYGKDGSLLSESFSSSNTSDPSDLEHALTILHQRDITGNIIGVSFVSSSGAQIANKTMKYDGNGRFEISLCYSYSGEVCENWLYGHNGQLLAETLPTGEEISHAYDEFFRETQVNSTFGKTVETKFGFCDESANDCADFSTAIYFKKTTSMFDTSVYEIYDKVDRSLGTTFSLDKTNGNNLPIQTNVYDRFGGFSKRTPVHYALDSSHENMLFEKDDFGRTTSIRRTYQQPGISFPSWQETTLEYSSNRIDISATDSLNTKPWKQVRITDSLAQVSVAEETNIDNTLLYWYDPKGEVVATVINNTAIKEEALVYRAKFDKFGAPYEIAFGNSGRYQYTHDSLGQLLNQTDSSGNVVHFRRKDQEKIASIVGETGKDGEKGFFHNFTYNNKFSDKIDKERGLTESGRLYSVNNTYDNRGFVINTTVSLDNQTTSLAYTYDADNSNRLERIVYPDGVTFLYKYDEKNRIVQILDDSDVKNKPPFLWWAIDFDAEGRPSKEMYGNDLQTEKSFDPWGISFSTTLLPKEVTSFQNLNRMAQNKPAFSFSAKFDPSGRVVVRERYAQGERVYSEKVSYNQDYQALNKSSLYVNETYSAHSIVFSYGNYSNLAYKSDVGNYSYGNVSSFGRDYVNLLEASPVNRVLEVTSSNSSYTFKYDDRGNRLSWNGTVITYNSRNKPVTISRGPFLVSFEYSPLGKLLMKSDTVYIKYANDTAVPVTYRQTWYMNDLYEKELVRENLSSSVMSKKIQRFYASTNILLQKTTYLNSSAATTRSYFYLHYDTKDSLAHVTDEEGNIVWEADYDVCGRKRKPASGKPELRYDKVIALINRTALAVEEAEEILTSLRSNYTWNIGYDGHINLFDLGDDLVHMGGRLYDTIHCLFLSPDPYLGNRWRAVGYNSYSYSEFNPLSSADPSGYVSLWRRIVAEILKILNKVLMEIVKDIALITGMKWLDGLAAIADALTTIEVDFLEGENWKAALIDGAITLFSDALSSVIGNQIASKVVKVVVQGIVTAALDGAKGAAKAAVTAGHAHRGKSIALAAGIGAVEGLTNALVDTFGSMVRSSVTKLISYSCTSILKSEIKSVAATVAIDTISCTTTESLKNIGKRLNEAAFTAKQASKEAEFMAQGMSSMQRATMTNGPLLFGSELKASTGHDTCRNDNALKSSQFSHLIKSFVPAKGPLSIDAVANIEKASDSFGRSHVSLHNHAIVQALFAGYNKQSVRDELFLFDQVSQLILAPSTNGKFLRQT